MCGVDIDIDIDFDTAYDKEYEFENNPLYCLKFLEVQFNKIFYSMYGFKNIIDISCISFGINDKHIELIGNYMLKEIAKDMIIDKDTDKYIINIKHPLNNTEYIDKIDIEYINRNLNKMFLNNTINIKNINKDKILLTDTYIMIAELYNIDIGIDIEPLYDNKLKIVFN